MRVERVPAYRQVLVTHLPLFIISGAILLAAFVLPLVKISLRICAFFRLTGYPCPSCGFTRAFCNIAVGQWALVLQECPLAFLLYGVIALAFAWNAAGLILGVRILPGSLLKNSRFAWGSFIVVCLLIMINWIYRLTLGLK